MFIIYLHLSAHLTSSCAIILFIILYVLYCIMFVFQVYEKNKKRAALFSEQELDRDNRKRLRQASKATNKRKKALEKPNPQSKDESLDSDRRIIQGKTSDNDTKSYSKSTEFFSQLQRQSEEKISSLKNQKNGVSNKSLLQGKEKNGVSFKLQLMFEFILFRIN